LSTGGLW